MSTLTKTDLNIDNIVSQIEATTGPSQKVQKGFQALGQQMQQSGDPQGQHWGQQLQQAASQLAKACQQS